MGLTEGHWFEDEEQLTERQLERAIENEKAAYEKGLQDSKVRLEWISVKKMLPNDCEDVLVFASWECIRLTGDIGHGKGVKIGWYVDSHWHIDGKCRVNVTYWMPLPKPPKEE